MIFTTASNTDRKIGLDMSTLLQKIEQYIYTIIIIDFGN